MESIQITLGGETYTVKALTIGQLTVVLPIFMEQAGMTMGDRLRGRVEIIATALSEDYPEMTAEKLMGVRATMKELSMAIRQIGILSGVLEDNVEEPKPGEAA